MWDSPAENTPHHLKITLVLFTLDPGSTLCSCVGDTPQDYSALILIGVVCVRHLQWSYSREHSELSEDHSYPLQSFHSGSTLCYCVGNTPEDLNCSDFNLTLGCGRH